MPSDIALGLQRRGGLIEAAGHDIDQLVDLAFRDDQRWRHHHDVANGADDGPVRGAGIAADLAGVAPGVERLARRPKPDIGYRMSPVGVLADVPEAWLDLRF